MEWKSSRNESACWNLDAMHFPHPLKPLDETFVEQTWEKGMNRAAEAYDLPVRFQFERIHGYHYHSASPLAERTGELEAQGRLAEAKLTAAMIGLRARWENEFLPEIQQGLAAREACALDRMTMAELRSHLEIAVQWHERMWEIHFLIFFPMYLAISVFDEMFTELFGADYAGQSYRLLQGFDNKTLEVDRALWELSREARRSPDVEQAILAGTDTRVREFLARCGRRSSEICPSNRFWIDDPAPVLSMLRDQFRRADGDPAEKTAALAAGREALSEEIRARLAGYPRPVLAQFESLLKAAQDATVLTEDHAFWIDHCCLYEVRRIVLDFGRRFVEGGVLSSAEDVWFLTAAELRASAAVPGAMDRRPLVDRRRAEWEFYRTLTPPHVIGTVPPQTLASDPMSRAIEKFFGLPIQARPDPTRLLGSAGSPGRARGPARIILSLSDAGRLRPGDVLVTATTSPAWTPLFQDAAAIVTDVGGILSHCAIVAREYGIPAVVGAGGATAAIMDGQMLDVDGSRGIVWLAPPEEHSHAQPV